MFKPLWKNNTFDIKGEEKKILKATLKSADYLSKDWRC